MVIIYFYKFALPCSNQTFFILHIEKKKQQERFMKIKGGN
jgi:hypothetical protein